jgi:hypothetical protein
VTCPVLDFEGANCPVCGVPSHRLPIRVVSSLAVPKDEVWLVNEKGDGVIAKVAPLSNGEEGTKR